MSSRIKDLEQTLPPLQPCPTLPQGSTYGLWLIQEASKALSEANPHLQDNEVTQFRIEVARQIVFMKLREACKEMIDNTYWVGAEDCYLLLAPTGFAFRRLVNPFTGEDVRIEHSELPSEFKDKNFMGMRWVIDFDGEIEPLGIVYDLEDDIMTRCRRHLVSNKVEGFPEYGVMLRDMNYMAGYIFRFADES